jgi:hypothetical protein
MPENHSLDLPPAPPKWRSLLPAWLRGLIWADQASSFDAFLSYSWKADSEIAPILQETLQKFLCPWYRIRALNIFRDLSALAATEDLEKSLEEKLERSHHLVALASRWKQRGSVFGRGAGRGGPLQFGRRSRSDRIASLRTAQRARGGSPDNAQSQLAGGL